MTVQDKRDNWSRLTRSANLRYAATSIFVGVMLGFLYLGVTTGEAAFFFSFALLFFPIAPAFREARLYSAKARLAWEEFVIAHDSNEREREIEHLETLFAL